MQIFMFQPKQSSSCRLALQKCKQTEITLKPCRWKVYISVLPRDLTMTVLVETCSHA